ncbi:hypothetical protein [Corynebacterium glyciniphilum]|uniref:hypothetical protein n=1 Tax=Corynebacterium glyciniphilum TaxID=1404244 RepID=UPI001642445A|nr:hypothetical protein [Corynebacterium glyciniphilum]
MPFQPHLRRRARLVVTLAATTALTLAGCAGNSSDSGAETSSATTSQASTPGMGVAAEGNGATVTVNNAYETDVIQTYTDGSWNTGEERPTEEQTARDGGKYVVVETTVVNDTTGDMDLTCRSTGGWVRAAMQVRDSSLYQPIDALYDIPGNPECNTNLGSGFDADMTWVFLIPSDREPLTFKFKADSAPEGEAPTVIHLDKLGEAPVPEGSDPEPTQGTTGNADETAAEPAAEHAPANEPAAPAAASVPEAPADDPVIGFTGAPGVDHPRVLDKQIASCGDPQLHETGTSFFTDGTSGWTEQCSAEMMQ